MTDPLAMPVTEFSTEFVESEYIEYTTGCKYQLSTTAIYKVPFSPPDGIAIKTKYIDFLPGGWLIIRAGYAWDGPSGLTIDTPSSMRAALAHDALYQLLRYQCLPESYRLLADELLRDIGIKDKMWKIRAKAWYRAVREFAYNAADPKNKKKIYRAPR